jgi:hypothetical protein
MFVAEGQSLFAQLWNETHSVSAVLAGVRVAVFFERPPRVAEEPSGPAVLYWMGSGRARPRSVRTSYDELARVLQPGVGASVVLARDDVPASVDDALWRALGYRREIAGQVAGYWFGPKERVPQAKPGYLESTALVAPLGATNLVGQPLLALAPIDSEWRPLLATAVVAYTFGGGLERGETWSFAPTSEPWPTLYAAHLAESIDGAAARRLFPSAASRLRDDPAVEYLRIALTRTS